MADKFANSTPGLSSPAEYGFSVAPDDAQDLAHITRAINVATSGTVRIMTVSGNDVTLYIAAGVAFPVRATRVFATGTGATGIVGLY